MKKLIDMLTAQLGIDAQQAGGGAGIIFKAARDKLGQQAFDELLGGVEGVSELIRQAPAAGGAGGLFGGLASVLGGNAALLASVLGGFGRLGMGPEQAKRFVPIILGVLRERIGPEGVERLEKALRT